MTVLEFPTPDEPDDDDQLVVTPAETPGALRRRLERVAPLPSRRRMRATGWWWCTHGARKLAVLAVRAPALMLRELRPISIGFARIVAGWSRWRVCKDYADHIALNVAAGVAHKDDPERLQSRRERHRKVSVFFAVIIVGAMFVAAVRRPDLLAVAIAAFAVVCARVGRKVAPHKANNPPPARTILREGVPLSQVTGALIKAGLREGLEFGIERDMRYDAGKRQYEIWVTCLDPITPAKLRGLEKGIGAVDYAMRSLAPVDKLSTVRRLVIREGDPLAEPTPRPFLPTGSRSITDPLRLGESMTDTPFELDFTQHVRMISGSGGGKTKWFMRACIDAASACHDVVILGGDITHGPELPMWRGVIQHTAFTPEEFDKQLDFILAEIRDRAGILAAIAEDDDPTNDADEWHPGLGSPYWLVFWDEYPEVATFDGKNGKLNLLAKCETVIRTARKHGIFLVMFGQKSGNSDFGSSVMSTQCNATVIGPCDLSDATQLLGAERRDQGYTPHLLTRGTKDCPNDAGKCFLAAPRHTAPDLYRAYSPGTNTEVKRRARQRMLDGLPPLRGNSPLTDDTVDAEIMSPLYAELERCFAANGEKVPTAVVLAALHEADPDEWGAWGPVELAAAVAPGMRPRGLNLRDGTNPRGYLRAELIAVLAELDAP